MEKFLETAKAKSKVFKLRCQTSLGQSLDKLPGRGFIHTMEGEMKVLKVIGDGNCQFRSVGLLLSGMDCEINHRRLRALAVEEFKTFEDKELKRTVFFTHHATDCITPKTCKESNSHNGAVIRASARPFKRLIANKQEYAVEMSKEKVWGNEYSI